MRRLAGILVFSMMVLGADPDIREIFERARILVARNENLAEAIRLYGQVVTLARAQHVLAARAQYEQGLLYHRIGKEAEAQRAFRAVVREFPDQKGVAALARARLPAGTLETGISVRQVWTGNDPDSAGHVSPDGRLISFTDSTGDLAVHDIETGENRSVTHQGSSRPGSPPPGLATWSVFSPDGRRLAYVWYGNGTELRIIDADGSGQRTLYRTTMGLVAGDWSADGKYVLAFDLSKRGMLVISVADGSVRTVPVSDRWRDDSGLFSPDGNYIVYDIAQEGEDPGNDIHMVSIATGRDVAVVEHRADDTMVDWSPDGSKLLFVSDRSGSPGIWAIPIVDGHAAGPPELLKPDMNIQPIGSTRQGSIFYYVDVMLRDVFVAEIDPTSGKLVSPPRAVSQRFVGAKDTLAWSPEGQYLIYKSPRGLSLHSMTDGKERDVQPENFGVQWIMKWHPDGRSVFVSGRSGDGRFGLFRLDLQTGKAQIVARLIDRPAFSADARTLYYYVFGPTHALVAHNLDTGEVKSLYSRPDVGEIQNPNTDLSPDGKMLAFLLQNVPNGYNSLVVMPATGGEPRTLLSIQRPERFGPNSAIWTPDMRYILVSRTLNKRSTVWRVPLDGGPPQDTGLSMPGLIGCLRLHPDGRRVAFFNGESHPEIWALENILPKAGTSRLARR